MIRIDGHKYQPGTVPDPALIRAVRLAVGHTQGEAAETVHRASYRRWQDWERGVHEMDPAVFGYYLIRVGMWNEFPQISPEFPQTEKNQRG